VPAYIPPSARHRKTAPFPSGVAFTLCVASSHRQALCLPEAAHETETRRTRLVLEIAAFAAIGRPDLNN
jgi:hypothetical protein